jgi:UDP-2-acetamido-3-amino-2,3-dideoxy-glucuronate N-acetyltransferase
MEKLRQTLVKRGSTLGANSTIICGNVIGKYSMVGAGAVVTKDVPDYAIVIGNPAKLNGWMCECGVKLKFNEKYSKCDFCKREYLEYENIVTRKETADESFYT